MNRVPPEGTPISPRSTPLTASAKKEREMAEQQTRAAAVAEKEKSATPGRKRGRKSISVISPASVKPTDDGSDPKMFKASPGDRKGDEEYVLVKTGPDTGLTGKYWADMGDISGTRRRRSGQQPEPEKEKEKVEEPKRRVPKRKQAQNEEVSIRGNQIFAG